MLRLMGLFFTCVRVGERLRISRWPEDDFVLGLSRAHGHTAMTKAKILESAALNGFVFALSIVSPILQNDCGALEGRRNCHHSIKLAMSLLD